MKTYGLACLLLAGCAAPSDTPSMPRPGSGIAEYREVTRQAHGAVANTVESLEALRSPRGSGVGARVARFDRAFNQLELTSVQARARAEAIIARGQNYFDEWKEQLAGVTNRPSAQADYNRLHDRFTLIRQRSSEVREEFRPFMARLRQFRARLDQRATADATTRIASEEIDALTSSGRRVIKSLESVSTALNDAEAELHATHYSKR